VLLRAGFFALVGFFVGFLALDFVLLLAALLLFFLVVPALERFVLGLLVARAFVREDRVFAMWPR
jgi:hypothetical protein